MNFSLASNAHTHRGIVTYAGDALREQLGGVPLVIDDVNRDRFTREVPDLVKFVRERAGQYAPIVISTNKQVSALFPRYSQTRRLVLDRRRDSRSAFPLVRDRSPSARADGNQSL